MTPHEEILAAHDYALIDPYVISLSQDWEIWRALPMQPLVPDALRHIAHEMPCLLPLKPFDAPYIKSLCTNLEMAELNSHERVVLSCLLAVDSGLSQDTLTHHLTQRLLMNSPQGYFRFAYHNSHAFLHLARIFWTEQICALYGPINTWTCRFNNGWISLPRPVPEGVIPLLPYIKAEQRERLDSVALINKAMAQWRYKLDNKPWRDLEEFRRAADQAERAIGIARREFALQHDDELIAFALHSLSYGEHFYEHARIRRVFELRDKYPDGWRYNVGTIVIKPDEWAAIAAETRR